MSHPAIILGAGMTGLAAGIASGGPIYEAADSPGGICSSYYVKPGSDQRLLAAPEDGQAFRFEIGGGHWLFGGDPLVLQFIRSRTPVKTYARESSVYFPRQDQFVPYPIQNHLHALDKETVQQALQEMTRKAPDAASILTMADWMRSCFGRTLCDLFFDPFHDLYTAGLWKRIAPQDGYKTPVNLSQVIQGAFNEPPQVGYNTTFIYPQEGLNRLAQQMAGQCDVHYHKKVTRIDVQDRRVHFEDQSSIPYETLISTLPLNEMIAMTGLQCGEAADPYTSVLVINIGAVKGPRCPQDHWVYIPESKARFHRVGFYSNVDDSFLPVSTRQSGDKVSIYVEKAYPQGQKPGEDDVREVGWAVVAELQAWGWIGAAEAVDPTWIPVAYTWAWPGSKWKEKAIQVLHDQQIFQVGRYARWGFQGVADSIRDGLLAGSAMKGRA